MSRTSCLALAILLAGCAGPLPECAPDSCADPDSVCVETDSGIACECRPGTMRAGERCVAPAVCDEATCSGHGSCSEEEGGVRCACEAGFGGLLCESCAEGFHDDGDGGCTDDPCMPSPCGDRLCEAAGAEARCVCPRGTHDEGGVCVGDTTCMATTCGGHGTCVEDGGVRCMCEAGWGGTFCEACDDDAGYHDDGAGGCTTDACLPSPCTEPNRGVCTVSGGEVGCACDAGYHVEGEACVADEVCDDLVCGNGACAIVEGRIDCMCDAGWAGAACDACDAGYHDDGAGGCTTDVCVPSPCTAVPNRSVCVDGGGGAYTCECEAGYHDDGVGGCTTDGCTPNPCAALDMACRGDGECYVPECDDGNPCTDDAVAGGACQFTPRADGASCSTTLCISGQTCTGAVCGGGEAVSCDDGNPCTDDACDALTGCSATADDTNVPDDGLACTIGVCAGGIATHTPSDALCDDGSWCSGVDRCVPGPGADARGCVVTDVPAAPGPNGPCGSYACDDAAEAFDLIAVASGTACDDRIACTTDDRCTGDGACRGTPAVSCEAGASCGSTAPWSGAVDVAPSRVTGSVLYGGSASFPEMKEPGVIALYLRARDTGILHHLEDVSYDGWDGDGYPIRSYDESDDRMIDIAVLPGVYDVVYRRIGSSSTDGTRLLTHVEADPYAFAVRRIGACVAIP